MEHYEEKKKEGGGGEEESTGWNLWVLEEEEGRDRGGI